MTPSSSSEFFNEVLSILTHEKEKLLNDLIVRKGIVAIVYGFLYSDYIAHSFDRSEAVEIDSEMADRQISKGRLMLKKVDNPFKYLLTFADQAEPSSVESAWILSTLAFHSS